MQHDWHVQEYHFWRRTGLMVIRPMPIVLVGNGY